MKMIIYAGVGLFSIASIYGAADYYSSQKSGSLNKLYREEIAPIELLPKMAVPVISADKKEVTFKNEEGKSKELTVADSKEKFARVIDLSDFSRGKIIPRHIKDTAYENVELTPLEEIKLDTTKVTVDK